LLKTTLRSAGDIVGRIRLARPAHAEPFSSADGKLRARSAGWPELRLTPRNYSNFTIMNPLCNSRRAFIQLGRRRLQSTERL